MWKDPTSRLVTHVYMVVAFHLKVDCEKQAKESGSGVTGAMSITGHDAATMLITALVRITRRSHTS